MGEWIKHDGAGMPVEASAAAEVKFRDGYQARPTAAANWGRADQSRDHWWWTGDVNDIVAYRITTPSPRPQHGGGAE